MGVYALDCYVLILHGSNVLEFINGLSTNKVDKTCTTVFTTEAAKIIDMCEIIVKPDYVAIIGHGPYKQNVLNHLNTRILDSDITIGDATTNNEVLLSTSDIEVGIGVTKIETFRGHIVIAPIGKGPSPTMTEEDFSNYRVDQMIPHQGHEITPEVHPLACGLGHIAHEDKGCYIGQEIIARMRSRNRQGRELVRLPNNEGEKPTTIGLTHCLEIRRTNNG
jgi:folate-binding protein YgfZ